MDLSVSNREFLEVLFDRLPETAAVAVASKRDVSAPGWKVLPWRRGQEYAVTRGVNGYYCISSHKAAEPFQRIKQNLSALHALMLDDIGPKVDRVAIRLLPTYVNETSEGNFQLGFKLKDPITDIDVVDRLGRAVIRAGLSDPGANGLSARLARLPQGWNSKRDPLWECRLTEWRPDLAYSLDELVAGLGLELDPPKQRVEPNRPIKATQSSPYGRFVIEAECGELASMEPDTGRNSRLNDAAFALGQLAAGGEIEEREAIRALRAAAQACGLNDHDADATIVSGFSAGQLSPRRAPAGQRGESSADADRKTATARDRFPRTPFPWGVLPTSISESLQQLARSCATAPSALPGQALCMIAACVGRKFAVSPKESWVEPLIFWCADIRDSGVGKTPPMNILAKTFRVLQAKEHERAEKDAQDWDMLMPKERKGQTPPMKPRGYFTTNLTLEGINADLAGHPTGGIIVLLSELSALLNGQGEYKSGKGTDRESWLCLHDGNAARVSRKSGSVMIHGARVQVCGGIQPATFGKQFAGQDGLFLQDGTIFRFLPVYESPAPYPLTPESWSAENSEAWEQTLLRAFQWADSHEPVIAALSKDAQARFLDWRNDLDEMRADLPAQFRGFLPKAYGYALRLTGGLHLLDRFSRDLEPGRVLQLDDIERGILAVEYFLGQALDALKLVGAPDAPAPAEVSHRTAALAIALDQLRDQTDNGKLAVGFIQEKFNALVKPEERMRSPRAMGVFLRACGVEPNPGKHDAHGRRAVSCVAWSEKIEKFITISLQAHGHANTVANVVEVAI